MATKKPRSPPAFVTLMAAVAVKQLREVATL